MAYRTCRLWGDPWSEGPICSRGDPSHIGRDIAECNSGVLLLARVMLITLLSDRNVILASNTKKECERLQSEERGDKVCVVVLGLAHYNGVKRLHCRQL